MVNISKKMKILVVDDFTTMRRIIKNLLGDLGFNNIDEADNGRSALQMLKSGEYDFLVTDWYMPKMDGIELLKTIREDEKISNLPVLLVTSEAKREHIVEAANAGINGYVVKPFTAGILKDKIERIFKTIDS